MRKRLPHSAGTPLTPTPTVHEIRPHAVYFLDQAQQILRLRPSTIRRELREGRLRLAKRAGKYFILGKWLIEWIESGEVKRRTAERNSTVD